MIRTVLVDHLRHQWSRPGLTLPRPLDRKIRMIQRNQSCQCLCIDEIGGGSSEYPCASGGQLLIWLCSGKVKLTAAYGKPARQETKKSTLALWGNRSDPVVHASLSRVTRDKLGERSSKEALEHGDQDEAVDDGAGSASVDLGHNT